MIFYILAVIGVVLSIRFAYDGWNYYEGVLLTAGRFLLGLMVSAAVIFVILLIGSGLLYKDKFFDVPEHARQETKVTKGLEAITNDSKTEGRYGGSLFISYGFVEDGKQVLNYVSNEGGMMRLAQAPASASVIYQDAEPDTAKITEGKYAANYWWFSPWNVTTYESYEFHVPKGTVDQSFTVDVNK